MDFFGWVILFTFAMTKCIKDKKLEALRLQFIIE